MSDKTRLRSDLIFSDTPGHGITSDLEYFRRRVEGPPPEDNPNRITVEAPKYQPKSAEEELEVLGQQLDIYLDMEQRARAQKSSTKQVNFVLPSVKKALAARAEAERLKRAAEQGFKSEPYYHGTMSPDIREFNELTPENFPNKGTNEAQLFGPAPVYATRDPEVASQYSQIRQEGNINPKVGGEVMKAHSFHLDPNEPGSITARKIDRAVEHENEFKLEANRPQSNAYVTSGFEGDHNRVQLRRESSNVLPLRFAPERTLNLHGHMSPEEASKFYDTAKVPPNPVIFNAIKDGRPVNVEAMYQDLASRLADTDQGKVHGGQFVTNKLIQQMGYDSMTYRGGQVMGDRDHEVMVMLDPKKVRSEFAQFKDPKSKNILAGGAAAAVGTGAALQSGESEAALPGNLTTSLLEKLPNQTMLKRATIEGILNQQGMKGAEKETVMKILGDKQEISRAELTKELGNRVLRLSKEDTSQWGAYGLSNIHPNFIEDDVMTGEKIFPGGWYHDSGSRIHTLPKEYQTGQSNHFGNRQDYFAHTRSYDTSQFKGKPPDTRSITEIQSDLMQRKQRPLNDDEARMHTQRLHAVEEVQRVSEPFSYGEMNTTARRLGIGWRPQYGDQMMEGTVPPTDIQNEWRQQLSLRHAELSKYLAPVDTSKLEPFKKGWHERVLREENRRAAKEGLKRMRVATEDTVADVEGWRYMTNTTENPKLKGKKVGELEREVDLNRKRNDPDYEAPDGDGPGHMGAYDEDSKGVFTGKVAVTPRELDTGDFSEIGLEYRKPDGELATYWTGETVLWKHAEDLLYNDIGGSGWKKEVMSNAMKQVDGLMRFYRDDVSKFVQKEFGAKKITDPDGNTWWQWDIKPEDANKPVKVWGAAGAAAGAAAATRSPPSEAKESPPESWSEQIKAAVYNDPRVRQRFPDNAGREGIATGVELLANAIPGFGELLMAEDLKTRDARGEKEPAQAVGSLIPGLTQFIMAVKAVAQARERASVMDRKPRGPK